MTISRQEYIKYNTLNSYWTAHNATIIVFAGMQQKIGKDFAEYTSLKHLDGFSLL